MSIVHHDVEAFIGVRKPLPAGTALTIGRGGACFEEGCLKSSRISRRHATLRAHADEVQLTDEGSHNGTFVNGRKCTSASLVAGDLVGIGPILLLIHRSPIDFDVPWSDLLIGRSHALARVLREIDRVAASRMTVLLRGETGTGKELVAREIHSKSGRSGPFKALNCGGIPGELLQSELFGHVKGAFTSALSNRLGLFQSAAGGTAFLDEIGDAAATVQVSLLRFLDDGMITPVGKDTSHAVDTRVVAASNVNFEELIAAGRFREDLYARLSAWTLRLPPLRERIEDIPLLVRHFIRAHTGRDRPVHPRLMLALLRYAWPRNIRELEAVVQRAVLEGSSDGSIQLSAELEAHLSKSVRLRSPATPVRAREPLKRGAATEASIKPDAERLRMILEEHGGNVSSAADYLGVSRVTIYRWCRQHKISTDDYRS
ncbi:sigma 54-interacting transcriptional regulator [Sorangium sp. So ce861]|uniref:sigma 54-interacting transcriptional regulator n=1 Tax=Sorangium sp. So ce861 TaxID=3133323 RepID=UPI003F5E47CC